MADYNRVTLLGRLCRDPELAHLQGGSTKCTMRLATSREWKDKGGSKQKDVCYVDVVAWARQAETCAQYLAKGAQCLVEGRLTYREWEDKAGGKRSKHEIVADRVVFIGGQDRSESRVGGPEAKYDQSYSGIPESDLPF